MSLSEPSYVANSTFQEEQAPVSSRLSPGILALIIIVSTFAFYMTLMFIVCMGEYWQYINGKKGQKATERQQRVARALSESRTFKSTTDAAIGSSMAVSQSVSHSSGMSREPDIKTVDSTPDASPVVEELVPEEQILDMGMGDDEDDDVEDSDNILNDTQEEVFVDCEQEISIMPLISGPCESNSVGDGSEILCDISDSKDIYRLEADV